MFYKVEIRQRRGIFDAVGEGIKKDIIDLGIDSVAEVSFAQIFIIEGELLDAQLKRICEELLVDKIVQEYFLSLQPPAPSSQPKFVIEVAYNPGVMDPVEESVIKGIRDLGIEAVSSVKTAKKYLIKGKLSESQLKTISEKLLYNKLIQHIVDSRVIPRLRSGQEGHPSTSLGTRGSRVRVVINLISSL